MAQNQIAVWDFTLGCEYIEFEELSEWLEENAKKWCFQKEKGEKTGYEHYQGRVSLYTKVRRIEGPVPECHWSVTSNTNKTNQFYVMKSHSRIDGPWNNKSEKIYIPKQVARIKKWKPWQEKILEECKGWRNIPAEFLDDRTINVLWDKNGCEGKSALCLWLETHGYAVGIPPTLTDDSHKVMRWVCGEEKLGAYLIDLPRGMDKKDMSRLFVALEVIKGGKAYDDRYTNKKCFIDSPCIWVFTNVLPKMDILSQDRWKIWKIDEEDELKKVKRRVSEDE